MKVAFGVAKWMGLLVLALMSSVTVAGTSPPHAVGNHVYEAAFHGVAPPATGAGDASYRQFRQRFFAYSLAPRRSPQEASWERRQSQAKAYSLERAAYAFSGDRAEGAQWVATVAPAYEWEGMPEGPYSEARATERYLDEHPKSALRPFLHLFAAQRYRAAAEASLLRGNTQQEDACWTQYRAHWTRAVASDQKLVVLASRAMADKSYVYLELPKKALCRETANGVPFFSPTAWVHTCAGIEGEVVQFERDIDGDGVPERFVALASDVGNAGGPFHVFKQHADGFTRMGRLDTHPLGLRRIAADASGRPCVERYWRLGGGQARVDTFVHDGQNFILIESRPATPEDLKNFGYQE